MKELFYTIGQCTYYIENGRFNLLDERKLKELKILSSNFREAIQAAAEAPRPPTTVLPATCT